LFTPGDFNTSPTVTSLHTKISLPTLLTFTITAKNAIPSGRVPDNLANEYAYFDFGFQLNSGTTQYSTNSWYTNKAIGEVVPCRATGALT